MMLNKTLLIALIFLLSLFHSSEGQLEDYCIADEQAAEHELVEAMRWACDNGADCSAIQENGACYLPNTLKDHASYAFNTYYQNAKTKGGSCYFNSAALLSDLNPSFGVVPVSHLHLEKMNYLGVGVSPGNVPVYHGSNLRVLDTRVRVAEVILRCLICGLAVVSAVLNGTDTQVKEIFTIEKRAKFTDMKALVLLVIANGIAASYSFFQVVRCVVSMVRGSVLFNKPLAWAIFSGDQLLSYLCMAAVAASAQSAVLSKYGQTQLQWMKTCTIFDKFCNQIGEGVACSLLMTLSLLILSAVSGFSLFRLYGDNKGKDSGGWS